MESAAKSPHPDVLRRIEPVERRLHRQILTQTARLDTAHPEPGGSVARTIGGAADENQRDRQQDCARDHCKPYGESRHGQSPENEMESEIVLSIRVPDDGIVTVRLQFGHRSVWPIGRRFGNDKMTLVPTLTWLSIFT